MKWPGVALVSWKLPFISSFVFHRVLRLSLLPKKVSPLQCQNNLENKVIIGREESRLQLLRKTSWASMTFPQAQELTLSRKGKECTGTCYNGTTWEKRPRSEWKIWEKECCTMKFLRKKQSSAGGLLYAWVPPLHMFFVEFAACACHMHISMHLPRLNVPTITFQHICNFLITGQITCKLLRDAASSFHVWFIGTRCVTGTLPFPLPDLPEFPDQFFQIALCRVYIAHYSVKHFIQWPPHPQLDEKLVLNRRHPAVRLNARLVRLLFITPRPLLQHTLPHLHLMHQHIRQIIQIIKRIKLQLFVRGHIF